MEIVHGATSVSSDQSDGNAREPLCFEVVTDDLPPDTSDLVLKIKQVAESVLFHWRSFPIVLPDAVAVDNEHPISSSFLGSSTTQGQIQPSAINHRTINIDDKSQESNTSILCQDDAPHLQSTENQYEEVESQSPPLSSVPRPSSKNLVLRDVFVPPSFDELDAVAVDYKGEPHKLSSRQLGEIQERGEFSVPSLHFPNQSHVWRVSEFLQKGTEKTKSTFIHDLAVAASLIVVTAKERLSGDVFSLHQAGQSLYRGLRTIVDLSFGLPWVQAHNLDARIKEERCSYLVQELTSKDGDIDGLSSWIHHQIKRATREKFTFCGRDKRPAVPYSFSTPQGLELDLRLFNRELMKKALPILVTILEKESRGWFLHFRENHILRLKTQGKTENEVEKECNVLVQEEYQKRVHAAILSSLALSDLGQQVPQLLVQQSKAVLLMHRSMSEVERIYEEGERSRREELKYTYPILSSIEVWLQKDLHRTHQNLVDLHKWRPHEHSLALCRQEGLVQHAYFLQRDLAFMREREPVLLNELQALKVPTRTFQWRAQIWFSSKFIVQRLFQGESEIIPTIIVGNSTTITTPRSDPNQPVYLLEKQVVRSTSTRWPLWRWFNFIHRSWAWTCNALFFLAVWVPLCSSLSLRALFSRDPFMPDYELSQVNGTVCPSKASLTPTLSSQLTSLWRHISKSRTHFETRPDTGFLGKGVSRNLDRAFNYLIKGTLGTLMLTVVFPLVCIVLSLGSIVLALTAPLWGPVSIVLVQISFGLVYDFDCPSPDSQKWFPLFHALLYDIIFLGFIQPLLAVTCALFVCPLLSAMVVCFAIVRRFSRHAWDAIMYECIIKRRGRVPASNSILVKRVKGPGMENDFVYQISVEQALAAFEARLETDELATFQKDKEGEIAEPLLLYGEFVQRCFGPFSGVLGRWGNFGRVEKEVYELNRCLVDKLERRRRELCLGLSHAVKTKIKMSNDDLKLALRSATILLEDFYPSRVLSKVVSPSATSSNSSSSSKNSHLLQEINSLLKQGLREEKEEEEEGRRKVEVFESEEGWWENRGVTQGDYTSLASLIFTEIFSPDFLTPLEESNTIFQMEVQGTSLSRYTQMIQKMPPRIDLDEKIVIHTPRGNVQVPPPYLDLSVFTPLARHAVPTHKTEKTSLAVRLSLRLNPCNKNANVKVPEKLLIPPPVPHPAQIALIIYNRDAVETISIEANLTKQVLRSIEDCPHLLSSSPFSVQDTYENTDNSESPTPVSGSSPSLYDQPGIYRNYAGNLPSLPLQSLSRTATLQMTSTLDKVSDTLDRGTCIGSVDSRRSKPSVSLTNRSTTLDSITGVPWLPSPLRSLLDQRPFSVNLNMPHVDTFVLGDETPDEETSATGSPHPTSSTYLEEPLQTLQQPVSADNILSDLTNILSREDGTEVSGNVGSSLLSMGGSIPRPGSNSTTTAV